MRLVRPLSLGLAVVLAGGSTVLPSRPLAAVPGPASCRPGAPADFNGDGLGDLAVGAPYATVAGRARAGAVGMRYGTRGGLAGARPQWWSQASSGVPHIPERGDGFGAALAVGDFDGDHCADLAIGVPEESLRPTAPGADGNGAVQILRGSPQGLRPADALTVQALGRDWDSDRFGAALAAGDLDGDGDDELVVGIPGLTGGGGLGIFGLGGPGLAGVRLITQGTGWVGQRGVESDVLGTSLAVGDFNGDRRGEVAVGAPGDGVDREGAVTIVDVLSSKARRLSQDTGVPDRDDKFGAALAAADFDGDGRADLAIGVPGKDLGAKPGPELDEGAVDVLYGSPGGLTGRAQRWSGNSAGLTGAAHPHERLGAALAAGDLDGDGRADLAIGAPGGGLVRVLRGGHPTGLSGIRDTLITGPTGPASQFGWALAVRSGTLIVGAPGTNAFTGAVTLSSETPPLHPDNAATGSLFGYALG